MKESDFGEVCQFAKHLRSERYRVSLLIVDASKYRSKLIQDIASRIKGRYYNVLMDILPKIEAPPLGAYGPVNFIEWLEKEAEKGNNILVVDEIEPLVSTFPKGRADVVNLFRLLATLEMRGAAMIATRLRESVTDSQFPGERIYMLN